MILITCEKLESYVYPAVVKVKFIVRVLQSLMKILIKPHNAVELIIDEKFLDGCIDATNAHGAMIQTSSSKLEFRSKMKKEGHSLKAFGN